MFISLIELKLQNMQDAALGEAEQQAADLSITTGDLTFGDNLGKQNTHMVERPLHSIRSCEIEIKLLLLCVQIA